MAALRIWHADAGAPRIEINAAARQWGAAHGLGDADWAALAARLPAAPPVATLGGPVVDSAASVGPLALPLACRTVPLPEGALVWLSPADGAPAQAGGRLALLKAFGRIGLYVRDLRHGHGEWDEHMFELVGLPPAAGPPLWTDFLARCVHPDDRAELDRHFRQAASAAGGRGDAYFRVCRPDGEVRMMHSLYEVRRGPDGQPDHLAGVLVDDTEGGRRLLEGERSRRFLARALDLAGVSVWRVDLASQRVHFDGVDPAGAARPAEGLPLSELRRSLHPDDRAAVDEADAAALRGDRVVDVEARHATAGGHWRRWLTRRVAERDERGRAVALIGISIDVTEREAERVRSATLAEQSRLVAQAMGVGFWSRDATDEKVLWDAQMYRLYGRDRALPPPDREAWISEHVHPADRERVRHRLQADIAAWAPHTVLTLRVAGADDDERWVRAWTHRYRRDDGHLVAMGMHLDVTEQRRLEEMQGEAERAARASREKSAFMALMSHRLRTPLNAVLGFARLLAQDVDEPLGVRQRERLTRIDAAGQELLAMIDDVFELACLDVEWATPARLPVPLGEVLAQVAGALGPLARQHGVALRLAAGDSPRVATDRRLLSRALMHLVAHGVRRNGRGGWVALEAVADADGRRCRLVVRDGGPQWTAQQRELLFDAPAAPAPEPASGDTLIGLDLVRHALERLGAQIDSLPPHAEGSGFVVRLPLADEAAAPASTAPLTLLCVEDNPVNLMLVQELVAMRPGIRLLSAVDGRSGLALAAAERPDAVLLDLQLPDLSGHEVLARLRADPALAPCKVIALSANAVPEDIRDALANGFDDYWTKPIDFDRFLAGLDALQPR